VQLAAVPQSCPNIVLTGSSFGYRGSLTPCVLWLALFAGSSCPRNIAASRWSLTWTNTLAKALYPNATFKEETIVRIKGSVSIRQREDVASIVKIKHARCPTTRVQFLQFANFQIAKNVLL
jgi:hypothetical protein